MHISKSFVLLSTLALAEICLAQPPEAPKKETAIQSILRMNAEGRVRAIQNLRKALDKAKVSSEDQNRVVEIVGKEDAQRSLIRSAWYQLDVAEDAGVDDDQYALFWQDFQKLCDQHRETRAQDSKILADKLQLAQNPRLNAYMTLHGFIGDETLFLSLVSQTASDAFGRDLSIQREIKQPQRVVVPDDKP